MADDVTTEPSVRPSSGSEDVVAVADAPATDAPAADAPVLVPPPGSVVARFRSARGFSTPFWIALLLGILSTIVFVLSASALFVFGVGVAMAFFLVPVVNWLARRGWPRWVAAIATVAVTILGILIFAIAIMVILIEQGVAFMQALPSYLEDLGTWYESMVLPEWLRSSIAAAAAPSRTTSRHSTRRRSSPGSPANSSACSAACSPGCCCPSSCSTC